jgi:peroxiredoxin Q/BCP
MKKTKARTTSSSSRASSPRASTKKSTARGAKSAPKVAAKRSAASRTAPRAASRTRAKPAPSGASKSAKVGAPAAGAPAPAFSLSSDAGDSVSLSDYRGKWVVVYFYPKDHTPGCTREAIDFQAAARTLSDEGAAVLGVSRDSIASHCSFKAKQGLRFPLLSDPSAEVHQLYGAYGEKVMYGRSMIGALRTTALIRPDGTLARLFQRVRVDGHADAVLAAIREEKKSLGQTTES